MKAAVKPVLESLEQRRLLASFTFEDGGITVTGTEAADTASATDFGASVRVTVNGTNGWFNKDAIPSGLRFDMLGGNDVVDASGTNLPTVQRGGAGDDTLTGGAGLDTLDGGAGFDTGRAGETLISIEDDGTGGGDAGVELVNGNLVITGTQADDVVIVSADANTGLTTVDFNGDIQSFTTADFDRIEGDLRDGNDSFLAESTEGRDDLSVRSNINLSGGDGNDTLVGGVENDTLRGGPGIDSLVGGDFDDFDDQTWAMDTGLDGEQLVRIDRISLDGPRIHQVSLQRIDIVGTNEADTFTIDQAAGEAAVITINDFTRQLFIDGDGHLTTARLLGGDDFADVQDTTQGVQIVVNLDSGNDVGYLNPGLRSAIGGGSGNDELYNLRGGEANSLSGGGGDDLIESVGTTDSLFGDSGNDILRALHSSADSDNLFFGGDGSDQIFGSPGDDRIDADESDFNDNTPGDGNDTVIGGGGDDWIRGFGGDDELDGGDGDDTLDGGNGFDIGLNGETLISIEDDSSTGGGGPTGIFYEDAGITVNGTSSNDVATAVDFGGNIRIILNGEQRWFGKGALPNGLRFNMAGGEDSVDASQTNLSTVQRGGGGNDTLTGGTGLDTLDGGAGFDVGRNGETLISIEDDGTGGGGSIELDGTTLILTGTENADTFTAVESGGNLEVRLNALVRELDLTEVTEIRLLGQDGDDLVDFSGLLTVPTDIDTGDGLDTVTGGQADDDIDVDGFRGDDDKDLIFFSGGSDEYRNETFELDLRSISEAVTVTEGMFQNSPYWFFSYGDTTHRFLANTNARPDPDSIVRFGSGDDVSEVFMTVYGGEGNDTITGPFMGYGEGGNDTLVGDDNRRDSLFGGDGDDFLDGGRDVDLLDGGNGFDTGCAGEFVESIEAECEDNGDIYATQFRIFVTGTLGDDVITAVQSGSDVTVTLNGVSETLDATSRLIEVYGVTGNDRIDFSGLTTADTFVRSGDGDDTVVGGPGDDRLFGDEGDDSLDGGAGDDNLDGGDGFDVGLNGETLISIEDDGSGGGDDLGPTRIFYENAGITVNGTGDADTVLAKDFGGNIRIQLNDTVRWFGRAALPNGLRINTGGGDDIVDTTETDLTTVQQGGTGDDTLLGGTGIDTLDGGAGFDRGRFGETLISIEDDGNGGGSGDLQARLNDAVGIARDKYETNSRIAANNFFSYTQQVVSSDFPEKDWINTDVDAWTAGYAPGTYWVLDSLADRRGDAGNEAANAEKYADTLLRSFPFPEDVGHRDIPGLLPWLEQEGLDPDIEDFIYLKIQSDVDSRQIAFNDLAGVYTTSWRNSSSGNPEATIGTIIDQVLDAALVQTTVNLDNPYLDSPEDPDYADRLLESVERHVRNVGDNLVREDGSTYHWGYFSDVTGEFVSGETAQGAGDETTWSRGQAWAILNFATVAVNASDPDLPAYNPGLAGYATNIAERTANWFIDNLPEDSVPYWDFSVSGDAPRDSSAAAIAASGLLTLSQLVDDGSAYVQASETILGSLVDNYLAGPGEASLLTGGSGNVPAGAAVDTGIIFGDYYFLAAVDAYEELQ